MFLSLQAATTGMEAKAGRERDVPPALCGPPHQTPTAHLLVTNFPNAIYYTCCVFVCLSVLVFSGLSAASWGGRGATVCWPLASRRRKKAHNRAPYTIHGPSYHTVAGWGCRCCKDVVLLPLGVHTKSLLEAVQVGANVSHTVGAATVQTPSLGAHCFPGARLGHIGGVAPPTTLYSCLPGWRASVT